ncbi:MAG: hypothetical protein ABL921_25505 [Pirellula sp.]
MKRPSKDYTKAKDSLPEIFPDDVPCLRNECHPKWKFVLLALIAVHLLGVVSEPLRFFSRTELGGEAPEFSLLASITRPYSQWLYLDHGYFFFAPNPGPGHLVQYSYSETSKTNAEPKKTTAIFPDRTKHRPRLLYHRYFMLSEFYHSRYAPSQVTEELKRDKEFMARWNLDNHFYKQLQSSIKKSLHRSSGAAGSTGAGGSTGAAGQKMPQLTLSRLERALPEPAQVLQDRISITDPRFVVVLPESMLELPKDLSGAAKQNVEALPARPPAEAKP